MQCLGLVRFAELASFKHGDCMEETLLGAIYAQGVISLRDLCRDDVVAIKHHHAVILQHTQCLET